MELTKQQKRILAKLNAGVVLTTLTAWSSIGIYALSQRVGELIRKGYPVRRTWITQRNKFHEKVRVKAYDLASEDRE